MVPMHKEQESEITKLKSILKKKEGTKIITLTDKSYCHSLLNTEEMIQKQIEMDELKFAADKEKEGGYNIIDNRHVIVYTCYFSS